MHRTGGLSNTRVNVLLVIGSLLLAMIIAVMVGEGFLRAKNLFFPPRKSYWGPHPPGLFVPDKILGYIPTPNFVGQHIHELGDYDIEVSINELGLRDISRPSPMHGETIIAVGDSQTFGQGVRLENTWPFLLEGQLMEDSRNFRVVNAGVPGYGLQQMAARYQQLAHIPHKLVIVGFLPSTLVRLYKSYEVQGSYLVSQGEDLIVLDDYIFPAHNNPSLSWANPTLNRLDALMRRHSLSLRFLNERLFVLKRRISAQLERMTSLDEDPVEERREVKDAINIFTAIKNTAAEHHAKVLVLFMANRGHRTADIAYYSEVLGKMGVYYLDLSKYWEPTWKFPHDMHYNEEGCRRIAEIVYHFLEERKLTSSSRRITSGNS